MKKYDLQPITVSRLFSLYSWRYVVFWIMLSLAFSLLSIACRQEKLRKTYQIIGKDLSLPNQMLYFTDAYSTKVLDSVSIKNGAFDLSIAEDKVRSGLISIRYVDRKRKRLAVLRFPISDGSKTFHNWFFIEDGVTLVEGFKASEGDSIHTAYYARVAEDGYENALVRLYADFKLSKQELYDERLQEYNKSIAGNSDSKFLMGCLLNSRTDFNKNDLKRLFELFSGDAKNSFYGRLLYSFFDADVHPSAFGIADDRVGLIQNTDKKSKLNILAFEGNRFSPFLSRNRQIDSLQAICSGRQDISISKITLDKDRSDWKGSLQYYRPAWPQVIVDEEYISFLAFKYNFKGLPLVVFIDSNGRVLKRVVGYSSESTSDYMAYVDEMIL